MAKGKGKATPTAAEDHIPGLVAFFGRVDESLRLLVDEARHTNALLFNLGADIADAGVVTEDRRFGDGGKDSRA